MKLLHKFIPAHDFSLKAATAALAAYDQDKFWEFHDQLFAHQEELSDAKLMEIAGKLNLDLKRFQKKMQDPALKKMVNNDFAEAKKLGVLSTPWVYINGRHQEQRALPDLVKTIDGELNQ